MAKINALVILVMLFVVACSYCARNIAPLDFKGIVTKRYIDSLYKDSPIIFVNSNGKEVIVSPDGGDTLALYQYIHVGDSLIKKKGSYDFKIVHNGEVKWCTMKCW